MGKITFKLVIFNMLFFNFSILYSQDTSAKSEKKAGPTKNTLGVNKKPIDKLNLESSHLLKNYLTPFNSVLIRNKETIC